MLAEYYYWQLVEGPLWLTRLAWNIQRMLVRYFSVPVMLRTLVAHWHRDALAYRSGTLSGLLMIFAWNQISRAIGFIIRVAVLFTWALSALLLLVLSQTVVIIFIAWPFLVVFGLLAGLVQLMR